MFKPNSHPSMTDIKRQTYGQSFLYKKKKIKLKRKNLTAPASHWIGAPKNCLKKFK